MVFSDDTLIYAYTIIYLITYLDLDRLLLVFPCYNKTGETESKLSQSAVNLFACIFDSIYFWSRKYILIASSDSWEMHLSICLNLSGPMKDMYVRKSFWKWVSCDWLLIFRKIVLFADRVIYLGSFKSSRSVDWNVFFQIFICLRVFRGRARG